MHHAMYLLHLLTRFGSIEPSTIRNYPSESYITNMQYRASGVLHWSNTYSISTAIGTRLTMWDHEPDARTADATGNDSVLTRCAYGE